jgi:hypothetical protein
MTRTALLALMAAIGLPGAGRAVAATDGTARAAALEALAAKADLPASRPLLPSILTDPDARMGLRDDGQAGGSGGGNGNGKADPRSEAPGQVKKEAQTDVAKANAAAANGEAARAAGQASADANGAAEKKREKVTREKHPKPPHPPKGGGN